MVLMGWDVMALLAIRPQRATGDGEGVEEGGGKDEEEKGGEEAGFIFLYGS